MNKSDLVNAVSAATELSKKDIDRVLTSTLEVLTQSLQEGEKIQLVGFGSFEVKKRAARTGRNPKSKEPVEIPASTVPVFKPGKALKDAVNK